jgi:anti-sigma factor RsiW
MKDPLDHELQVAGLKGKLTAAQEARWKSYLAEHPEEQAAWEEEASLNQALRRLPDAPLSSNFTAQVLRLVDQETQTLTRASGGRWWQWLVSAPWRRKLAMTAALVAVSLVSYQQHLHARREEVARGAATFSSFATWPTLEVLEVLIAPRQSETTRPTTDPARATGQTLEILENFEAIKRLEQVPPRVDIELVAALQ